MNDHADKKPEIEKDERRHKLNKHHRQTQWVYWLVIILGIWLLLSPLTFNYADYGNSPDREIWLSRIVRVKILKWSDIISGVLLIYFGWRSLVPNRPVSIWICCFIGIWLNFAPLLFWAPSGLIYLNDTLIGAFIIGLTILIPGMPNMIMFMKMGAETPSGWSYNPSSWPQRWIMIVTGFLGWMVSRYLAAYQLGYSSMVWDPFFGNSSMEVLNSAMSKSLPVSDAGLGSLAYTFEFLMGFMGSPSRWRTMPWMVAFFGVLVIPLGLVHIFLVISQPLIVGAWCSFCIVAAAIMLPMIPLEVDEVVAMGQHMIQATRKGEKFWKVFWKGGMSVEKNKDERTPDLMQLNQSPWKIIKASVWGMSFPWSLTFSMVLGISVMALPGLLDIPVQSPPADTCHLLGALIVVTSVICMGEVLRIGRYLNILLGAGIAIIPGFMEQSNTILTGSCIGIGVLVIALAFPRGPKNEKYGLWDKYVR